MYPYVSIGPLTIPSFLICLFIAIGVSLSAAVHNKSIMFDDKIFILNTIPTVIFGAALCGRLLYALVVSQTFDDLFRAICGGGSVFYGCVLGGTAALLLSCNYYECPLSHALDLYALYLPLGQSIGRIGCYFNGCCYGRFYNGFLSVAYRVGGVTTSVYPTWFIESLGCLLIFAWLSRRFGQRPSGWLAIEYFISYSLLRILVEFYRGDSVRGQFGPLSTSQVIALLALVCCVFAMKCMRKQNLLQPEKRRNDE